MLSHMQASYGRPWIMTSFDKRLKRRKRRLINHTWIQNNQNRRITHTRIASGMARNDVYDEIAPYNRITTRQEVRSHVSLTKSISIVRRTTSVSIVAIQATLVEIAPTRSIQTGYSS